MTEKPVDESVKFISRIVGVVFTAIIAAIVLWPIVTKWIAER
jgi:TRAP-type C4-dicarboxylate transport system permease small subunit